MALSWVILSLLGCAGPVIQGRIIEQGPHDIIRLDREQSDSQSGARFDHPSLWTPEDMSAILARLLLEDRVGFMDSPKPPRPVFSPEDIRRLSPLFSAALSQATPSEWVSFVIKEEPAGGQIMLTSGGLFLTGGRLHIVLANHRAATSVASESLAKVEAHPFYALRGPGGALGFESTRFILGRESNWSAGHRASASELILDHRGFLALLRQPGMLPRDPLSHVSSGEKTETGGEGSARDTAASASGQEAGIAELRQELQQLRQRVVEQDREIQRLKGLVPSSPSGIKP
ncbi:MAG: hypothetical protein U0173_07295 [Nitrospiraceae bacterium]